MNRSTLGFWALAGVALVVACGGPTTASTTPSPSTAASAAASASPSQSAAPTTLDPCQLVTSAQASTMAGTTFGAGKEETTGGGGKICVYGSQTLNVFTVTVAQASDAATAQADWAQEESQVKSQLNTAASGVTITFNINDVSNVSGADRAAVGTGSATFSGQTINVSVIFVLKGANFLSIADDTVGHAAPSISALEAQAQTSLSQM
jgi:hypothetical protein